MSNRGLFVGVVGLLLLGLVCACGTAGFFLIQSRAGEGLAQLETSGVGLATFTPLPGGGDETLAEQDLPAAVERTPIPLPADAIAILRAEETVLTTLYENVSPSVVNISISGEADSVLADLGQGSGFVWDTAGHIVTNNHVVADAQTVFVTFADNREVTAEVVGRDPNSDLAVVRVEVAPELLRPVALAPSSQLRAGQRVVAIGNPFGFDQTMTIGVLSAIGRTVPGEGSFSLPNLIQTDAAINPGNSGGPLLDIEGRVIGVNTLIFSQSRGANSGVGFAVPSDKVGTVVPALIANGVYQTPYLGIQFLPTPLTPDLAGALELANVTGGVLVLEAVAGDPAAQAGVRGSSRAITVPSLGNVETGGDVIVAIDGRPVQEFSDIINYIDTRAVGDTVTLSVIRDGQPLDVPVVLGARPDASGINEQP